MRRDKILPVIVSIYGLPPFPPNLDFVFICYWVCGIEVVGLGVCGLVILGLCVCQYVGLWVRMFCLWVCGLTNFVGLCLVCVCVCLCVCVCVCVFTCLFVFACRVFLCSCVIVCDRV